MNYIETLSDQIIKNNWSFEHKGKPKLGWQIEYEKIKNPIKSTKNAEKHMDKNRYSNILPYDDNQVQISEYINASWVNGSIVTQWPLENTVEDFWEMICKYNVVSIIALTKIEREDQCCYWHQYVIDTVVEKDYIIRTLKRSNCTVKHYQYTAWPDFKCPNVESLLALMNIVDMSTGIKCIHCSAGVGRAGTFMTIEQCLKQINNKEEVDINQVISNLREQRLAMVQTAEQYAFCYYALVYFLNVSMSVQIQ